MLFLCDSSKEWTLLLLYTDDELLSILLGMCFAPMYALEYQRDQLSAHYDPSFRRVDFWNCVNSPRPNESPVWAGTGVVCF